MCLHYTPISSFSTVNSFIKCTKNVFGIFHFFVCYARASRSPTQLRCCRTGTHDTVEIPQPPIIYVRTFDNGQMKKFSAQIITVHRQLGKCGKTGGIPQFSICFFTVNCRINDIRIIKISTSTGLGPLFCDSGRKIPDGIARRTLVSFATRILLSYRMIASPTHSVLQRE
jgi:hypothetical protein